MGSCPLLEKKHVVDDITHMPPRTINRRNTSTVKRPRVSLSGRSRTEAVAAAANKRRRDANAARRQQLMTLMLLAHLASKANRRRRPTPKGLGF